MATDDLHVPLEAGPELPTEGKVVLLFAGRLH